MEPSIQLRADNICKSFGQQQVLRGISLAAHQGDVIAMIGASGSGKSTFLRCLNLLESPQSGQIMLGGEVLDLIPGKDGGLVARQSEQLRRLRRQVAMVFQHFNLWAHMTALDNVMEAPIAKPRRSNAPRLTCSGWGFTTGEMPTRRTCLAGSSSGWPSPAHWLWSHA
jgi:ABC-type histidine transport system ATPase subunit